MMLEIFLVTVVALLMVRVLACAIDAYPKLSGKIIGLITHWNWHKND